MKLVRIFMNLKVGKVMPGYESTSNLNKRQTTFPMLSSNNCRLRLVSLHFLQYLRKYL